MMISGVLLLATSVVSVIGQLDASQLMYLQRVYADLGAFKSMKPFFFFFFFMLPLATGCNDASYCKTDCPNSNTAIECSNGYVVAL
jgi:hypothetical protein